MSTKTLLTALLSLFLFSGAALAEGGTWHTSWDSAAAESKKSGKPILMDFTGSDWCGWCIKLKDEVFKTAEFKAWAEKKVVLLELDFPRKKAQPEKVKAANKALMEKYAIRGFPTIVFAKSNGEELGRYGYDKGGPAVWTKKAEAFLK